MKAGKLDMEHIQKLFEAGLGTNREDVIAGPSVGLDCAVVSIGNGRCAVIKSDPITFATKRIGWYAVHVNANDIATSGADPAWFMSTILLPPETSEAEAKEVFEQISQAASSMGVAVAGGHTEVTAAVNQIVIAGTMVGLIDEDKLIQPSATCPGDILLITKGAAIEATSIIANEKSEDITKALGPEIQKKAAAFLDEPGISILPEVCILRDLGVHSMHDATEGGVRAAVYEMATASSCSVCLEEHKVPIHNVTSQICQVFSLDPLACIASGALLAAVHPDRVDVILAKLSEAGIESAAIGKFLEEAEPSVILEADGSTRALLYEPQDEIARLFEEE